MFIKEYKHELHLKQQITYVLVLSICFGFSNKIQFVWKNSFLFESITVQHWHRYSFYHITLTTLILLSTKYSIKICMYTYHIQATKNSRTILSYKYSYKNTEQLKSLLFNQIAV